METETFEFDLAVSFAGEQRTYVEQFVRECEQHGLTVAYDADMGTELWGKNLIIEFRRLYGGARPRYVVPFISTQYLNKAYPMDELEAAIEQAFHRPTAYILPVVVGDVTPPREWLNPAIAYLRADNYTPAQLAGMIAAKVRTSA